eukprot:141041-Chlamydomonas_euryale.AAC.1
MSFWRPVPYIARTTARRYTSARRRLLTQVTYDDPLAAAVPCFYCTHCFDMMHIDASGARLRPEVVVYDYDAH